MNEGSEVPSLEASDAKRALALLKYRAVCICNTIRYPRVREAIDRGARSVEDVADATGCTTGECHGERCRPVIQAMLDEARAADAVKKGPLPIIG